GAHRAREHRARQRERERGNHCLSRSKWKHIHPVIVSSRRVGTCLGCWLRLSWKVLSAWSTQSSRSALLLFSLNLVSTTLPSGSRWTHASGLPAALRILGKSPPAASTSATMSRRYGSPLSTAALPYLLGLNWPMSEVGLPGGESSSAGIDDAGPFVLSSGF